MALFDFVGDLSNTKKSQLDFMSGVLQERGFKGSKVLVEPVGDVGDNFIANVKRIVVKENDKELKMIAKLDPNNPQMRENSILGTLFKIEAFAYTHIFPKYEQKFNEAGLKDSEKIKFPKCYGVSMEASNEVILLEDLKEFGFGTFHKEDPITDDTLYLLLRFLAVYHSLAFVVRYQEPDTFLMFINKLGSLLEMDTKGMEIMQEYFNHIEKEAVKLLEDDNHKKMTHAAVSNYTKMELEFRKVTKGSKYTAILHGDLWVPNFMFKFENGVPTDCILVDYQLIKVGSPANDLMLLILNNTTHIQRSSNFHNYIDYYHEVLDKALNNFGLKANNVYPREKLDDDIKMQARLAYAGSVLFASLLTKSKDEAKIMKENMELGEEVDHEKMAKIMKRDEKSAGRFKARIEDLLASYSQLGLIEMLEID